MHNNQPAEPNRNVNCGICGEWADGQKTISLDAEMMCEISPESFELIGKLYVIEQLGYEGEAHRDCFENFEEHHEG